MTKEELISLLAEKLGITKAQAKVFIDTFGDAIVHCLSNKGTVTIPNVGTFSVTQRKERNGRNPLTGDKIVIPAKYVTKFSPTPQLKNAVNA